MTRLPYIDEAIIPKGLWLRGNHQSAANCSLVTTGGEAFAHFVAAEFTGLALSPSCRCMRCKWCRPRQLSFRVSMPASIKKLGRGVSISSMVADMP
jgi:hypothetical protein